MKKLSTHRLARAGVIAGLYTAISLIVSPITSGAIQVRIAEALCMLPLFYFESIPALFVGCLLSNLITGCAPFDVIFGSIITLTCAFFTYIVGKTIKNTALKIIVGGIFPITLNAFLLPLIWIWCYGALEYMYILQVAILLLGQSVSIYAIGTPLYFAVRKMKDKYGL